MSAEGGYPPPSVSILTSPDAWLPLAIGDLTAITRLGDDTFIAWATRGWWAAHTSKERP